jgi:hypothetical protein
MEFFIPGLLIFLLSISVTFFLVPKATPMIAAVLSIIFLMFGVYQHSKLFLAEYRLSTWQDELKVYSPAVMIFAIILYLIYGMISFFTSGQVPVPSVPSVSLPSPNTATEAVMNSINNVSESLSNATNSLLGNTNNKNKNKNNSLLDNLTDSLGVTNNINKNKNKKNGNLSRSFLETV